VVGDLAKIGQVKLVLAKRWREPYAKLTVFATSDTRLNSKAILAVYERRWMIEQLFKDLKGSLGLGQYQMQSQEGIIKHLYLCGLVYLTLTRQSLQALDATARKSKDALALPSLNERLANTQQALRQHRISKSIAQTRTPSLRMKLRRLLALAA
jgi:SRSO17 transposase